MAFGSTGVYASRCLALLHAHPEVHTGCPSLVSGTQTPRKKGGVWALGWGGSVPVRWNAGVAVIANYDAL